MRDGSAADEPAAPRGDYLTRSRALALEREMAALEARLNERVDGLEREVEQTRAAFFDAVRAQAAALLDTLRPGHRPNGSAATPIRRTGGSRS